jgi:alkanesulfonate monooxygenase SsuD/methylene tetrahydromethanopterin reductase-like flavin-dependent oxidoreductase (luciferase family)
VPNVEVGVQFWPWNSINDLVSYASQAMEAYPFDTIWMCDEFQYEDPYTVMAAMAMNLNVSTGTMVTFPWRNPLDLAQRFASLAKLVKPGRSVSLGIGGGGSVQVQVVGEKRNPVAVMRESVELLRELFAGNAPELARFPRLAERFRYNTGSRTRLYFPPPQPVPVLLAAGGPRMYELAGRSADGVIFSQLVARTSYRAAKTGLLQQAADAVEAERREANDGRPFKRIYNLHMSVSRDGEKARQWAKRNASYGLSGAYMRYPEVLTELGLDPEEIGYVAEAYLKGLGVDEAARRVSDSLLERAGFVFAGTPEECIEQCRTLTPYLEKLGFDHWIVGVPLGPDVPEALQLLSKEVIPAVIG